jgi:hypothetical protein
MGRSVGNAGRHVLVDSDIEPRADGHRLVALACIVVTDVPLIRWTPTIDGYQVGRGGRAGFKVIVHHNCRRHVGCHLAGDQGVARQVKDRFIIAYSASG